MAGRGALSAPAGWWGGLYGRTEPWKGHIIALDLRRKPTGDFLARMGPQDRRLLWRPRRGRFFGPSAPGPAPNRRWVRAATAPGPARNKVIHTGDPRRPIPAGAGSMGGVSGVAEEMLAALAQDGLLETGRPVVVMLSGGRDSVCLLDLAVRHLGAELVRAMHVNYGLRDAADGDQRYCRELCERLGVGLSVTHAHTGSEHRGNVQAWARELRYRAATELAQGRGALIAAGHTATDQVETILYRLASSPSRRALLGMRAREGLLVRPLLSFTRAQTTAYCRERGLAWRDDETNATGKYARGRVRGALLPALRGVHPGAERNILTLAQLLRDEALVLDGLVDQALGGRASIELARLRQLPPALARLIVQRLADEVNGRPAPGAARRLAHILALRDTGTAHIDLPHGVRATAVRGLLSFEPTPRH